MFLARIVAGSHQPEVKHPIGPGQPRTFEVDGEQVQISGRLTPCQGVKKAQRVLMDDGTIEEHDIGSPTAEMLACDDMLVTTLLGASWPGSAGHRHAQDKLNARISIAVAEGRYFTESELHAQRRRELVEDDPEVRVAILMGRGLTERQARVHLSRADGSPGLRSVDELLALKEEHLSPSVDPLEADPSDPEALPGTPEPRPKRKAATKKKPSRPKVGASAAAPDEGEMLPGRGAGG